MHLKRYQACPQHCQGMVGRVGGEIFRRSRALTEEPTTSRACRSPAEPSRTAACNSKSCWSPQTGARAARASWRGEFTGTSHLFHTESRSRKRCRSRGHVVIHLVAGCGSSYSSGAGRGGAGRGGHLTEYELQLRHEMCPAIFLSFSFVCRWWLSALACKFLSLPIDCQSHLT